MPGFSDLRIQRTPMRMLVRKGKRDLVIDQLSDGEKCLLAMTGDLARRLALANPAMKDPLHARGIVLIDEIDLHLHPTWQRQVIPALTSTFPHCQFVASTHSPQVIGSVPKESVKLLEDGQLVEKLPHTLGRDANAILSEIMDVPPHPLEPQRRHAHAQSPSSLGRGLRRAQAPRQRGVHARGVAAQDHGSGGERS